MQRVISWHLPNRDFGVIDIIVAFKVNPWSKVFRPINIEIMVWVGARYPKSNVRREYFEIFRRAGDFTGFEAKDGQFNFAAVLPGGGDFARTMIDRLEKTLLVLGISFDFLDRLQETKPIIYLERPRRTRWRPLSAKFRQPIATLVKEE